MALASGTKLGPYEIVASLGAGGMGEVYRARDTRLERDVAVKVLPANLSSDPSLRQRLEREAKAVSRLSHPHICTLHDIGHQDGIDFLVMELVEGDTLEQRLAKGPLPREQTVRYAAQIADALAKAHKLGFTHRDLKPSNIMLTRSGAKLMDFGLAKQSEPAPLAAALTAMTMESKLTEEGAIVGTFQYMAPEQLEGKDADARTDIFALGGVIYEMATGKAAFAGKARASLIAAILTSDPPAITQLQPMAPSALERVVKKCLAKDPEERWQSASDLAAELNWISESSSSAFAASATASPASLRGFRTWRIAAVGLFVIASLLAYSRWRDVESASHPQVVRAFITPPGQTQFRFVGDLGGPVAVSPDGTQLVFSAGGSLWVRVLSEPTARRIEGTQDAIHPFWSPNGRFVGFAAGGKLRVADIAGGPLLTLCDAPNMRGASWGPDGTIIFTPSTRTGIFRVAYTGGTPQTVTRLDPTLHTTHRWPHFLPDGRHFLYLAANHAEPRGANTAIYVASLDGRLNRMLLRSFSRAEYASGYLLYLRETTLVAQPFDPDKFEFTGDALNTADSIAESIGTWGAVFSASKKGVLAYQAGGNLQRSELRWYDREGRKLNTLESGIFHAPRISPAGTQLAVDAGDPNREVWIFDLHRGVKTRLTFGGIDAVPVWSPDGAWIAFSGVGTSSAVGAFSAEILQKKSNGEGQEQPLLHSDQTKVATDWSRDGRFLLFDNDYLGISQVYVLPLTADRKPYPFAPSNFVERSGHFSPDGHWVAYTSTESGRTEVYVAPFPGPGGKWQVSSDGGTTPRWRRDGRELFFISEDNAVMSATVEAAPDKFDVKRVQALFRINLTPEGTERGGSYDVTADGSRFIINSNTDEVVPPITLVLNWPVALKSH